MAFRLWLSSLALVVMVQHTHWDLIVLTSHQYPGCTVSMSDAVITAIDYPRDPPATQDVIDRCSTLPTPQQIQAWLADETLMATARAAWDAAQAIAAAAVPDLLPNPDPPQ